MSRLRGLRQKLMTEVDLDKMKGHWLKVIHVWTLGFLTDVTTDSGGAEAKLGTVAFSRAVVKSRNCKGVMRHLPSW